MKIQGDKVKKEGEAFLAKESKKPGIQKTASGLLFASVKAGQGAHPKKEDKVKVHYRGTLINGQEFDSSYKRNKPAEFPLNRVLLISSLGCKSKGGKSWYRTPGPSPKMPTSLLVRGLGPDRHQIFF